MRSHSGSREPTWADWPGLNQAMGIGGRSAVSSTANPTDNSSLITRSAMGGARDGKPGCSRIARVASGGWITARGRFRSGRLADASRKRFRIRNLEPSPTADLSLDLRYDLSKRRTGFADKLGSDVDRASSLPRPAPIRRPRRAWVFFDNRVRQVRLTEEVDGPGRAASRMHRSRGGRGSPVGSRGFGLAPAASAAVIVLLDAPSTQRRSVSVERQTSAGLRNRLRPRHRSR
jgi:hypothetical protein